MHMHSSVPLACLSSQAVVHTSSVRLSLTLHQSTSLLQSDSMLQASHIRYIVVRSTAPPPLQIFGNRGNYLVVSFDDGDRRIRGNGGDIVELQGAVKPDHRSSLPRCFSGVSRSLSPRLVSQLSLPFPAPPAPRSPSPRSLDRRLWIDAVGGLVVICSTVDLYGEFLTWHEDVQLSPIRIFAAHHVVQPMGVLTFASETESSAMFISDLVVRYYKCLGDSLICVGCCSYS